MKVGWALRIQICTWLVGRKIGKLTYLPLHIHKPLCIWFRKLSGNIEGDDRVRLIP